MMNNKGFTLIEVLAVLVILSIATFFVVTEVGSAFGVGSKEAYKLMKNNIISASYDYIEECVAGTISCNFSFDNNHRFVANTLKNSGYFQDLDSPIDGKDLGECLIIDAKKENGVILVDLIDECY